MARTNIYFGFWKFKPSDVNELSEEFRRTSIPEMRNVVHKIPTKKFWTNNPYWLDYFRAENIYLCFEEPLIRLSDHPNWPRVSECFTPAEFAANLAFQAMRKAR